MSHHYDNFDDAYTDLIVYWLIAQNYAADIFPHKNTAFDYWAVNDDHNAIKYILYALTSIALTFRYYPAFIFPSSDDSPILESIYWANKDIPDPPEFELTWKAICEAWVKNDFEGRFWTIGIIDRMRQIMWDEPFDLTWAARPEQKEI